MYPEQGAEPAGDFEQSSGFKSRISYNLEGLIPLILILIIIAFIGAKFGFWSIPFVSAKEPIKVLVIGEPSHDMRVIMDEDKDLVRYFILSPEQLNIAPAEQLAQYDVVILDQADLADKFISRQVGEGIENWVKTGGKLVVVENSAILEKGASDIIGWKALLGDIMPVECNFGSDNVATCAPGREIRVTGKIITRDFKHKIMEGITQVPVEPGQDLFLETFNVTELTPPIAYIQASNTGKYYPAIVEKQWLGIGKVVYFNYDPGLTRGIFEHTLEYLGGR